MIVSGLLIERKKITQQQQPRQSNQSNKKPPRPYSSQLPEIKQALRKSSKNIELKYQTKKDQIIEEQQCQQNKTKHRHLSSSKTTKLVSKKNLSSTKQFIFDKQTQSNTVKTTTNNLKKKNNKFDSEEEKKFTTTKNKLQLRYKSPSSHGQFTNKNSSINYSMLDEVEKQKLTKYFRYYPMIIIQSCMKRQAFMTALYENGEIQVYNKIRQLNNIKKKNNKQQNILAQLSQPFKKLSKLANLKGKYKYRQKFNFNNSAQLKAIKWKRKQVKKKKQSSSSSSDQDEKKQKCRDMETWKKTMGAENAKVFIIKGKYTDFKNALIQRGWVENPDKHSSFFDLKWTTKVSDIVFQSLKGSQIVNHFNNNACLTSKYGICKSLRSVMYSQEIDVDRFFPKAFDLTDCSDFQNFLQVYKWVYCESVLKAFIVLKQQQQQSNQTVNKSKKINLEIIKLAYVVISRRMCRIETVIKNSLQQKYFLPSIREWLAIFQYQQKDPNLSQEQFHQTFQNWDLLKDNQQTLCDKVQRILQRLRQYQPQFDMNGCKNIWIVKPAFLSRGRGIKCLNKFYQILNYSLGKQTQYVVQKYIQNPLIINRKKFDIRQWVLVEDYNPPKIWIYGEFYCRFCIEEYDQKKITNRFAHLTNNSVQKYNKNLTQAELKESLKNSMWTQEQLKAFVEESYGNGSFKKVQQKIKEIVITTILSTADQIHGRKNSFELIGYDFMIDDKLNPWLIQINTSPAMDYSTPVTQRLVKMVLQDVAKVVVDLKSKKSKKKTAGLFKCVYNGEDKFVSKHYNLLKNNSSQQSKPQTIKKISQQVQQQQ